MCVHVCAIVSALLDKTRVLLRRTTYFLINNFRFKSKSIHKKSAGLTEMMICQRGIYIGYYMRILKGERDVLRVWMRHY